MNEYCSYENFRPTCSLNEIILITSAIYGRMNEGRCLKLGIDKLAKLDPKYFGCSADVLEFMDGKCSGRTECSVGVYDQHLRQKSSCYNDIESYLEASYACASGKLNICNYNVGNEMVVVLNVVCLDKIMLDNYIGIQ